MARKDLWCRTSIMLVLCVNGHQTQDPPTQAKTGRRSSPIDSSVPFPSGSNSYQIKGRNLCKGDEIAVLKVNHTECYSCPTCVRGQGATYPCGSAVDFSKVLTNPIGCARCIKEKNYSPKRSTGVCKMCTVCQENRLVKKCTRRSDTVCGKCKNGYYEEIDVFKFKMCEKCSKCCHDGKDKIEQQCVDQGLASGNICSRWPDAERCSYKQNDQPGFAAILNLTTTAKASTARPPKTDSLVVSSTSKLQQTSPTLHRRTSNSPTGFIANASSTTATTLPIIASNSLENHIIIAGIILSIIGVIAAFVIMLYFFIRWLLDKKRGSSAATQAYAAVELQPSQEGQPTDQEERPNAENSTKIRPYLNDPLTYTGRRFEQICDEMDNLKYNDFERLCISLGIDNLKVRQFYPHGGTGNFREVLRCLSIQTDPQLTLEVIAIACGRYPVIRDMIRAEDKRFQDKQNVEGNSQNEDID